VIFFFFFKQKTAYEITYGDWSSDVCSSDLTELIASLNFDYKEISLSLFKLYHYCQYEIRRGNFDNAVEILKELRDAWAKAFNLK